MQQLACYLRSN